MEEPNINSIEPQLGSPEAAIPEHIQVKPPRPYWFDFFLLLGSFGTYIPFWMVSQIRDLKKLNKIDATPWAWFFVPIVGLAQFWALPRLGRHLVAYETKVGLDPKTTGYQWWVPLTIVMTFFVNALDRFDNLSMWFYVVAVVAFITLFSLLVIRINRIKFKDPRIKAATHLKKYRWWEWVIVTVGTPASLTLMGFMIAESIPTNAVAKHKAGTEYVSSDHNFKFPISYVSWTEVNTPDDDEDLVAFTGPNNELVVTLYEYDRDMTINDIASYRYQQAIAVATDFACEEEHGFIENTLNVKAILVCETSIIYGADAYLSSIIQEEDRVLEMFVEVSTTQNKNGTIMKSARAAAEGFSNQ